MRSFAVAFFADKSIKLKGVVFYALNLLVLLNAIMKIDRKFYAILETYPSGENGFASQMP